jgi:hypothetical protein
MLSAHRCVGSPQLQLGGDRLRALGCDRLAFGRDLEQLPERSQLILIDRQVTGADRVRRRRSSGTGAPGESRTQICRPALNNTASATAQLGPLVLVAQQDLAADLPVHADQLGVDSPLPPEPARFGSAP